jgi:hypothetical protein
MALRGFQRVITRFRRSHLARTVESRYSFTRGRGGGTASYWGERHMDGLVHYVCIANGHQQLALFDSRSPSSPNVVTLNEARWSYCPAGVSEGHQWQEIAASSYGELREEVERRIRTAVD